MEHKNEELSPKTRKAAEFIALVIVSAAALAIIMIIFITLAAWYRTVF